MSDRRKVLEERLRSTLIDVYCLTHDEAISALLDLIEQSERETLEEVARRIDDLAKADATVDIGLWAGVRYTEKGTVLRSVADIIRHWRGNTGGGGT